MKRKSVLVTVILALLLLIAGPVLAQEEVTLEGLAEQLAALVDRVGAIEEKIGFPDTRDECWIAFHDKISRESLTAYFETFDSDHPPPMRIVSVARNGDRVTVKFITAFNKSRYVEEYFDGCEFVGHSDWWD